MFWFVLLQVVPITLAQKEAEAAIGFYILLIASIGIACSFVCFSCIAHEKQDHGRELGFLLAAAACAIIGLISFAGMIPGTGVSQFGAKLLFPV